MDDRSRSVLSHNGVPNAREPDILGNLLICSHSAISSSSTGMRKPSQSSKKDTYNPYFSEHFVTRSDVLHPSPPSKTPQNTQLALILTMTLTGSNLFLLLLITIVTWSVSGSTALEMQDVPAYTSAAETKPCATECAITPSAAFKTKYACDPVNPVSCICANETASVELRDSMSTYCYEKCDGLVGPHLATSILAEYCRQDWEGKTITDPPLGPTGTSAGTTGTPKSSGAVIPPTEGPNTSDGGLKRWETIVLGTVIPIVGVIMAALGVWLTWRHLKRKNQMSKNSTPGSLELQGGSTDTSH